MSRMPDLWGREPFAARLRRHFLTGILVVTPMAVAARASRPVTGVGVFSSRQRTKARTWSA